MKSFNHASAGGVEDVGAVLDVEWTVTADYASFSAEDYFYEGGEVPEGEAVIEKIQVLSSSAAHCCCTRSRSDKFVYLAGRDGKCG